MEDSASWLLHQLLHCGIRSQSPLETAGQNTVLLGVPQGATLGLQSFSDFLPVVWVQQTWYCVCSECVYHPPTALSACVYTLTGFLSIWSLGAFGLGTAGRPTSCSPFCCVFVCLNVSVCQGSMVHGFQTEPQKLIKNTPPNNPTQQIFL